MLPRVGRTKSALELRLADVKSLREWIGVPYSQPITEPSSDEALKLLDRVLKRNIEPAARSLRSRDHSAVQVFHLIVDPEVHDPCS